MINAKIIQFRRGKKTITEKHFLIEVPNIDSREKASEFVGKKVSWKTPTGKEINGVIASPHGNKGVLRAIFEKGLPGQAVSTQVTIL